MSDQEHHVRTNIDQLLTDAGWVLQDRHGSQAVLAAIKGGKDLAEHHWHVVYGRIAGGGAWRGYKDRV